MHDVAVNDLSCPKEGIDFRNSFLHKAEDIELHFLVTLCSPASNPLEDDMLYLSVSQFDSDISGFHLEFAYDPEEQHRTSAECVFFVL